VFTDVSTLRTTQTVRGGARDYWYFFNWNGFRPRAANLDQPVTFPSESAARDTMIAKPPPTDTTRPPNPPMRDASPTMVPPPASYSVPPRTATQFMVSFAAVLDADKANRVASEIVVGGIKPHVIQAQVGSTLVFRVVLGPYATREEAERVGRESKRQYWVYEGSS
jgi:cell division septation protein DedD